jgi:hypothetical protein
MSFRRTFRFVALLAPLVLFVLVLTSPYYSARLSLVLHGRPFARVVPKERLDIFTFVSTDSLACRAIVFSKEKAVGRICLPSTGGFASFVPFSDKPDLEDSAAFDPWFDLPLLIAWSLRWWLLPTQVILLLLWLRMRQRRVHYSRP